MIHPKIVHNFYSPQECEKIVKQFIRYKQFIDDFGHKETGFKDDSTTSGKVLDEEASTGRKSYRRFPTEKASKPIVSKIRTQLESFKFDLFNYSPELYFMTYTTGHFVGWHNDEYERKMRSEKKVSAIVMLSDESKYEGGDLEFTHYLNPKISTRKQGTLIVFPSYMFHQVNKITSGERHTLLTFFSGPPLR